MRLFLSSYRAGKYPHRLIELFGQGTKVAVVTNAKDYKTSPDRALKVKEILEYLNDLKLNPMEVDLRRYFSGGQISELKKYTAFWLSGGNAFLLRRALNYSGLDKYLADSVRKNEVVLGGESAGAIIMGPTLKYSELDTDEDSPYFIPNNYDKKIIWEGLGFITYVPVPHYKDTEYRDEISKYISSLKKSGIAHKTMTNDQAIVINGSKEELLR